MSAPSTPTPQNLEAEESTLGAMMLSESALSAVVLDVRLRAEDFYKDQHRKIFAAILRVRGNGHPVDALTVAEDLAQHGELDGVGGRDRVSSLSATAPAPGNARHHAEIVRKHARTRAVIETGHDLIEGRLEPDEAIGRIRALDPEAGSERIASRSVDGGSFVLDTPEAAPTIWGRDGDIAWASGEPLMIAGPQGVGKTTLGQRLALHRAGLRDGDLLGMPIEVDAGRVLYIAADRPAQAARSLRRMVGDADRDPLSSSLVVWKGPLPFDVGRAAPGQFADFVGHFSEVGTVVVDSLKDIAVKLSDDEVGSRVNAEHQHLIANGCELVLLHHQRKASGDNKKPRALDDVYGSTWLTSGTGSVLLLWGKAGDPIVELHHLKQPAGEVGPLNLMHDHQRGSLGLHEPATVVSLLQENPAGLTVRDAAVALFGAADPDPNQIEKARRRLEGHAEASKIADSNPAAYVLRERRSRA